MRCLVPILAAMLLCGSGCATGNLGSAEAKYEVKPEVFIRLVPSGHVCAQGRDDRGVLYQTTIVYVNLIGMPPSRVVVNDNGVELSHFDRLDTEFAFRYPAGVGYHYIKVRVGDRVYDAGLAVHDCTQR